MLELLYYNWYNYNCNYLIHDINTFKKPLNIHFVPIYSKLIILIYNCVFCWQYNDKDIKNMK